MFGMKGLGIFLLIVQCLAIGGRIMFIYSNKYPRRSIYTAAEDMADLFFGMTTALYILYSVLTQ